MSVYVDFHGFTDATARLLEPSKIGEPWSVYIWLESDKGRVTLYAPDAKTKEGALDLAFAMVEDIADSVTRLQLEESVADKEADESEGERVAREAQEKRDYAADQRYDEKAQELDASGDLTAQADYYEHDSFHRQGAK